VGVVPVFGLSPNQWLYCRNVGNSVELAEIRCPRTSKSYTWLATE
jgi:hypothetical protein